MRAEVHAADDGVRYIGEQDADDDVDLKESDEAAAPFGGRNFGDVHGAEDGRSADAEAADEAKEDERRPAPGKGAADGGEHIEDGHDAKTVAAAIFLSGNAGAHGANDRAGESAGDSDAEQSGGEVIHARQGRGGAGDDGGVKAEEQAAQRAHDRALYYMRIDTHSFSKARASAAISRRRGRTCPSCAAGEAGFPSEK